VAGNHLDPRGGGDRPGGEQPRGPDLSPGQTREPEPLHASWKLLLPMHPGRPVLAVGLGEKDLQSLARSSGCVHVLASEARAEPPALKGVARVGSAALQERCYRAVAVGRGGLPAFGPRTVFGLLGPGGSGLWLGGRRAAPRRADLTSSGFGPARRYALLPPATGKILLPISTAKLARAGLSFYTPGRWRNRLAVRVARIAAAFGVQSLMACRGVVTARAAGKAPEEAYLLDWLRRRLDMPVAELTIHAGHRTGTVQLLDEDGQLSWRSAAGATTESRRSQALRPRSGATAPP